MYGKITNITNILAYICCAAFVFLIPFGWQSANYILGSFALFAVMNPKLYQNFKTTKLSFGEKAVLAVTAAYILWEIVTFLWSFNLSRGVTMITRHLPLFAMPCLLVLAKIGGIIKRPGVIMQIFCLGVIVSMILCLILSYRDSFYYLWGEKVFNHCLPDYRTRGTFEAISSGFSYFSYSNLSHFVNPHYFGLYINVLIMTAYMKFYDYRFKPLPVILLSLLILFCMVFLFMLCNRANYIVFALLATIVVVYEFFVKKHKAVGIAGLIGLAILMALVFGTGRGYDIVHKVTRAVVEGQDIQADEEHTKEEKLEGVNSRAITWSSAMHLIAKHPVLGSGIGDTEEALIGQYYIDGYLETAEMALNCHNQYLDSWIGCGIPGLLILLCFLVVPIAAGLRYNYLPLILYAVAITVGFITEVMFTRSTGCFTSSFLMMLLIMCALERRNTSATKKISEVDI